ncbi:histidine kinase [Streptomyces sp. TRM 70361]|uniref:sensor histidine kinase n=1 Tax=Streptomyces sp. TRM 70361 TaxID=3116553 RepID=UPI002E7B47E8|nr:histidine kinase [Streptomyces sp. TRM 70361]MEE1938748.1 histidine kinase [Streptomyces sp. TRM 70361]
MTARSPAPPLARPHRDDVLIAVAGLAGGLVLWRLGLFTTFPRGELPGGLSLLPLAVMSGAELLRRTAQPWALWLATAALAADLVIGSLLATVLMFTDVVYAAVLYGPPGLARRVPPATVLVTIAVTLAALFALRGPEALTLGIVAALVSVGPAFTGSVVRDHRDRAVAERLRAEQTALLAEMDRVQAVTAERARMARELHDVVANHLSAIAVHSTAAQSLDDPAATREALAVIRENSVQGLAEMRRLIGLLRDAREGEEVSAAPTLEGLDALLAQARAHGGADGLGFVLRDERSGGPLPAPVELAAYRIVQEALTNALKHASPGPVTVCLTGPGEDGGPLTVRVTSPLGARPGPRAPGSGAGLIGMRERVGLLGGDFSAGPAAGPGGGERWEVRAVLPVAEERTEARTEGTRGRSGG